MSGILSDLEIVENAIRAGPSPSNLYKLLKVFNPQLTGDNFLTREIRDNLFKKLKTKVHPDKHVDAKDYATRVFQDLDTFYQDSHHPKRIITPEKEAEHPSKRSRPTFPDTFRVEEYWSAVMNSLKNSNQQDPKKWCFNARGHIVHNALTGRKASAVYPGDQPFHSLPAGTVESIKRELMLHGPVLSTSFQHPFGAAPRTVIILGWKQLSDKREAWLVRTTPQDQEARLVAVPFGSYSLTDVVQIPKEDPRNMMWQYSLDFPYLEVNPASVTTPWSCSTTLSANDLSALLKDLGKGQNLGMVELLASKRQIEICPKGVMAQSRRAEIVDVVHNADGSWTLLTNFV
ncbi:hypothetical protein B484DRAFT_455698 [Ochromonadaceae sp. CCMP2298]|nr:hypothetical protein B484DRAFT_455698 [Ochromonadaceae sp. CCMP2298]